MMLNVQLGHPSKEVVNGEPAQKWGIMDTAHRAMMLSGEQ